MRAGLFVLSLLGIASAFGQPTDCYGISPTYPLYPLVATSEVKFMGDELYGISTMKSDGIFQAGCYTHQNFTFLAQVGSAGYLGTDDPGAISTIDVPGVLVQATLGPYTIDWSKEYAISANHVVYARFTQGASYYEDPFGYSTISAPSDHSPVDVPTDTDPNRVVGSNGFYVATTWNTQKCAIPTNFSLDSYDNSNALDLVFNYKWESSTGVPGELSHCWLGEIVAYPGYTGTLFNYFPPSPPFDPAGYYPNPRVAGGDASVLAAPDHHTTLLPNTQPFPVGTTSFVAQQSYFFYCTCYHDEAGTQIYPTSGNILITRSVAASSSSSGVFSITKSGVTASVSVP